MQEYNSNPLWCLPVQNRQYPSKGQVSR